MRANLLINFFYQQQNIEIKITFLATKLTLFKIDKNDFFQFKRLQTPDASLTLLLICY